MNSEQILEHFRETGALLEGHFILSSGLHSENYLQCALALQDPEDAARYGQAIAEHFLRPSPVFEGVDTALGGLGGDGPSNERRLAIETVASPAIGGLMIGFAVAQSLKTRFLWTERQDGIMTLRRGFTLRPNERILVVEDVITTGGSTRECIEALERHGAKVVAAASIVDRSNGTADVGVPRMSLVSLDVPSYAAANCPMCAAGLEAAKPGSRTAAK